MHCPYFWPQPAATPGIVMFCDRNVDVSVQKWDKTAFYFKKLGGHMS